MTEGVASREVVGRNIPEELQAFGGELELLTTGFPDSNISGLYSREAPLQDQSKVIIALNLHQRLRDNEEDLGPEFIVTHQSIGGKGLKTEIYKWRKFHTDQPRHQIFVGVDPSVGDPAKIRVERRGFTGSDMDAIYERVTLAKEVLSRG